jgi:hypothetical protein
MATTNIPTTPQTAVISPQQQQQSTIMSPTQAQSPNQSSPFPVTVVAQHGTFIPSPASFPRWIIGMLISQCVDFPGTGEDEIAFQKGEIIAVIAKDDGFGDGWWTVIPPSLPVHVPLISEFPTFSLCFDPVSHGGGGHKWVSGRLKIAHACNFQRAVNHCCRSQAMPSPRARKWENTLSRTS